MFDALSLIEMGYLHRPDLQGWLEPLAPTIIPAISPTWRGGSAYIAAGAAAPDCIHVVCRPGSSIDAEQQRRMIPAAHSSLPPDKLRSVALAMRTPSVVSITELTGRLPEGLNAHAAERLTDALAVIVPISTTSIAIFAVGCQGGPAPDPAVRRLWQRTAIHLSAGARLVGRQRGPDAEDVDAVLEPTGTVVHARQAAKSASARDTLRNGAIDMDRARTRAGRADPLAALELWRGLLAGRWSLIEHFDSDGRRFILVRRNEPGVDQPKALSKRQRQVVFYASLGWSNKEVAFALGLAENTVSAHLTTGLAKLGIKSRAELVRISTDVVMAALPSME